MQHILIEIRLRRRAYRCQCQRKDDISRNAVVLVDALRVVHAPVQTRCEKLRDADQRLDDDEDVGDEAEDGVWGLKMYAIVRELVVFDDDEAGDEGEDADVVEGGVDVGSLPLLGRGVGGLQDEGTLSYEEDASRV